MKLKRSKSIISVTKIPDGISKKVIIKNGTKLNQVLHKLPHGIINKNHTGIGATTLELMSKRNSIIVEPLKVTASTKAKANSESLYVGSPTLLFPEKITDERIQEYLNDKQIKYKKIIVVVDSLVRVLNLIDKINYNQYFLMIDESDSIQLDSGFRDDAMNQCIYYYKLFPEKNRCLISATPLKMNDPELQNESITEFCYENEVKENITLVYTNDLVQTTVNNILLHYRNPSENDKIVIAHNNVEQINKIALDLINNGVNEDEITILCGANSKEKTKFFKELDSDILPTLITLKTSAYFSGFDISERYHLYTLVDTSWRHSMLSLNKLKQIAGRCRHPSALLSETIVYKYTPLTIEGRVTSQQLISWASEGINAFNCISTVFGKSSYWSKQSKELYRNFTNPLSIMGYNLLTEFPESQNYGISYLSIDAILYLQNTINDLYSSKTTFENALKSKAYNVDVIDDNVEEDLIEEDIEFKKNKLIELERIMRERSNSGVFQYPKNKYAQDQIVKTGFHIFSQYMKYINHDDLISKILVAANSVNTKKLKTLKEYADTATLHRSTILMSAIMTNFLPGDKIKKSEVKRKVEKVLQQAGVPITQIDEKVAMKYFKRWITCSNKVDPRSGYQLFYLSKHQTYNPYKFQIENYKLL